MAILGSLVYSAAEGSAYSDESMENPYIKYISIEPALLSIPYLSSVITDTHFSVRDRMGRSLTFLARIFTDQKPQEGRATTAACDEQTALLLDITNGSAETVGKNHCFTCFSSTGPDVCQADKPLTFQSINCMRLSAETRDSFNFETLSGQGVSYINSIVDGHFTTAKYGP